MKNSKAWLKNKDFIGSIPKGIPIYIFGSLYGCDSMSYLSRALAQQLRDMGRETYVLTDEDPSKFPYFYLGHRYRSGQNPQWRTDGFDYISISIMDGFRHPSFITGKRLYTSVICDDWAWRSRLMKNLANHVQLFSISDFSARYIERQANVDVLRWRVPIKRLDYKFEFELKEFPQAAFTNVNWRDIPKDLIIILAVASPQPRKNWELLLHAHKMAGMDALLWLHATTTKWGSAASIIERARGMFSDYNSPMVMITEGEFGEAYLDAMYRRANYYISVSSIEGLGIPLVRAKQEGCKVIAVPYGGFTEYVEPDIVIPYTESNDLAHVQFNDLVTVLQSLV